MKKVLLLGAGYGNMALLTTINKDLFSQAEFTLINNNPYHYKTIALHDVASGKHDRSVLFQLKDILDDRINIIQDTIISIDSAKVQGKNDSYEYNYLVVGLGFSSDSFGIPGVGIYTQSITSYESAKDIYKNIEERLQTYLKDKDSNNLAFIVCGGGFTGIEFAGSLAQEVKKQCDNRGIDFNLVKIYCIEAMPKILPMFSENLMHLALRRLRELGVAVLTDSKILECKMGSVVIEKAGQQETINANSIIWTAGVKGNEVIANSRFFKSGRSKVEVDAWLQPINQENKMDNIFIIGDCSALKDETTGRFYPPTAQLAQQQGEYLAQSLETLLYAAQKQESLQHDVIPRFEFQMRGSICSIGAGYAIGIAGTKEVQGFVANALKWLVESKWSYKIGGFQSVFKEDQ